LESLKPELCPANQLRVIQNFSQLTNKVEKLEKVLKKSGKKG
jgi:hypothetical protein